MDNKKAKKMIERLDKQNNPDCHFDTCFPWQRDYDWKSIKSIHRDKRIMLKLKKRLGDDLFSHVDETLLECEACGEFDIQRFKEGSQEGEPHCYHTNVGALWIDERENGGYSGDSYSGYGYIKISNLDFLKFSYYC